MATIVTRASKGAPLTFVEADDNFININNETVSNTASVGLINTSLADKLDKTGDTMTGNLALDQKLSLNPLVNTQSGGSITINPVAASFIVCTGAITSIAGLKSDTASPGDLILLQNLSGAAFAIKNQSASALANDRIFNYAGAGALTASIYAECYLANGDCALFIRDASNLSWRMIPIPTSTQLTNGFKLSAQSVPSGSSTVITFGSLQSNTDGNYVAAAGLYTVDVPGYYEFHVQLDFTANATGTYRETSLWLDNGGGFYSQMASKRLPVNNIGNLVTIDYMVYLSAGDKVQIRGLHDATSGLSLSGTTTNFFYIKRVK